MNRENLQRIVDHLKTIEDSTFDMSHYMDYSNTSKKTECGSVACAIGHSIQLDVNNVLKNYTKNGIISFYEWSTDFTGLSDNIWDFCFNEAWYLSDNTVSGAIKRIECILNGIDISTFEIPNVDIYTFIERNDYETQDDFVEVLEEIGMFGLYETMEEYKTIYN